VNFDLVPTFRLRRGSAKERPPRRLLAVAAAVLLAVWAIAFGVFLGHEGEISDGAVAALLIAFIVYSAGYVLFLFDLARNPSLSDSAAGAWAWAIYLLPLAPVAYCWRHARRAD
jgi:hypothetical protein